MDYSPLQQELRTLAGEKDAVILAHNYQRAEVQDAADYVGDSLGLSRQAAASQAGLIVFCGVDFMAETAAILAPQKRVIHPEPRAGCPMAAMVDPTGLAELRERHPKAVVVTYVNSSAAVKALSDICCTSANATAVVNSIPADKEIIFAPDCNLGAWVARKTGREMILWEGYCPTHDLITPEDIVEARERWPKAKVVAHPECRLEVSLMADAVESTSGMVRYCREDGADEYIIATEKGMIHRLEQDVPGKAFHLATEVTICPNMKMTTLGKVVNALRAEQPVVIVPEDVRLKALRAVQRMVEIGS
jgi:quinolinate synthase